MACSHPIVDYVAGNYAGCCETAQSICDWLVVHSNGWLQFGGCFGYAKTLTAGQVSIHATGRAIDVNVYRYRIGSAQNEACKFLLNTYIVPNACTLGIQRLVFEGRVWTSGEAVKPWTAWTTAPASMLHTTALHIEITPETCGQFRYQDVNALMVLTSSLVFVGGKLGDPVNPQVETLAPSVTGNGTDGTAVGGGYTPSPHGAAENQASDTNPVWSSVVWELGACAACGDQFNDLLDSEVIQQTHCGGTGAICVNKTNGQTCSTGTAPDIGDFPGAVKDFIWWGNGAYGLSENGMTVYYLGDAVEPVFEFAAPDEVGPWESIFGVGPSTIAVSKVTPFGPRSLRATVNSIADYSCCEPAVDAAPATLNPPFALYNFALDNGAAVLNGRGTSGDLFSAASYSTPSCPSEVFTWFNDHEDTPTYPSLPTIFSTMADFGGDWCSGALTLIASFDGTNTFINGDWFVYGDVWNGFEIAMQLWLQPDGTGYVYLLLRDSVNPLSATGDLYVEITLSPANCQTGTNVLLMSFDPSAENVYDSMVAYLNGAYVNSPDFFKSYTPVTCTQLSGNPNGEFPAPYASITVEAFHISGLLCDDPVTTGGLALARGYPSQTDLDYWQQYDWSTHEGFAP